MTEQWKIDAAEVGRFVRGGTWSIGLLIARNVDVTGKGGGSVAKHPDPGESKITGASAPVKVSSRAFAKEGKFSKETNDRYLKAWESAAKADLVPSSSELSPGAELVFDENKHTTEEWAKHYDLGVDRDPDEYLPGRVKGPKNERLVKNVKTLVEDPEVLAEIVKQALQDEEVQEKLAKSPEVRKAVARAEAEEYNSHKHTRPSDPDKVRSAQDWWVASQHHLSAINGGISNLANWQVEEIPQEARNKIGAFLQGASQHAEKCADLFYGKDVDFTVPDNAEELFGGTL